MGAKMSEKYEASYKCSWPGPTGGVCACEFSCYFKKIETIKGTATALGKKGICSAVSCPKCGHNLKPINDAITIKEIKEVKK